MFGLGRHKCRLGGSTKGFLEHAGRVQVQLRMSS